MKNKNASYNDRYKHKLNMLEPGAVMLKIIGALAALGIVFWVIKWHLPAAIAWVLGGIILAVLLVLAAVESHQDKVLNEIARRESEEAERK